MLTFKNKLKLQRVLKSFNKKAFILRLCQFLVHIIRVLYVEWWLHSGLWWWGGGHALSHSFLRSLWNASASSSAGEHAFPCHVESNCGHWDVKNLWCFLKRHSFTYRIGSTEQLCVWSPYSLNFVWRLVTWWWSIVVACFGENYIWIAIIEVPVSCVWKQN